MENFSFAHIRLWVASHERTLSYTGLILGFIFDATFFRRVDLPFENLLIILHFVAGLFAIIVLHVRPVWYDAHPFLQRIRIFLPFVMQFAIGGLFGKFLIFYSKSGALIRSWPFLLMLIILFVGNESFRGRYEKLNFRLAIFFTALFSYCIFFVPVLTKDISDKSFLLSGFISFIVMVITVRLLHHFVDTINLQERMNVYGIILGVYIVFNIMYFTNIIPPIPLALKEAGVYHSITRNPDGNYEVTREVPLWRDLFSLYDLYHWVPGTPIYFYSAIFSPTELNTNIIHEWQMYEAHTHLWRTAQRVELPIVGGRDGGYRTYSLRSTMEPGFWRVNIETPRGQLIGRIGFQVEESSSTPSLQTSVNF